MNARKVGRCVDEVAYGGERGRRDVAGQGLPFAHEQVADRGLEDAVFTMFATRVGVVH